MSLREFIKQNREELKRIITAGDFGISKKSLNSEQLRLWILNDEGLYRWARSEGVPI